MSNNLHMSVAMQWLVDFISMVTRQYVTSQLRYPLHNNGLLRMDRPTENPASKALQKKKSAVTALTMVIDFAPITIISQ
jgi:hypothetical protein